MKSFFASLGKNSIHFSGSENVSICASVNPCIRKIFHCFSSLSAILFAAFTMGEPVQCHPCAYKTLNPFKRLNLASASTFIDE